MCKNEVLLSKSKNLLILSSFTLYRYHKEPIYRKYLLVLLQYGETLNMKHKHKTLRWKGGDIDEKLHSDKQILIQLV